MRSYVLSQGQLSLHLIRAVSAFKLLQRKLLILHITPMGPGACSSQLPFYQETRIIGLPISI